MTARANSKLLALAVICVSGTLAVVEGNQKPESLMTSLTKVVLYDSVIRSVMQLLHVTDTDIQLQHLVYFMEYKYLILKLLKHSLLTIQLPSQAYQSASTCPTFLPGRQGPLLLLTHQYQSGAWQTHQ